MLQFVTCRPERFSTAEQVQMALEGGCKWIELDVQGITDGDRTEATRVVAEQIIPLCREAEAFLLLTDEVDLAEELGCHGVHLRRGDVSPAQARERLGAGAIIGVSVKTPQQYAALRNTDVDYVSLDEPTPELLSALLETRERTGMEMAIVAGNVTEATAATWLARGAQGVWASSAIADAADPVLATAALIRSLHRQPS